MPLSQRRLCLYSLVLTPLLHRLCGSHLIRFSPLCFEMTVWVFSLCSSKIRLGVTKAKGVREFDPESFEDIRLARLCFDCLVGEGILIFSKSKVQILGVKEVEI